MSFFIDGSAAFRLLVEYVPRDLARELLVQDLAIARDPDAVEDMLQDANAVLREIASEHEVREDVVEFILLEIRKPFDPSEINDTRVEEACRMLVTLWLKGLDQVRQLVEDAELIVLTDQLLPDPSLIPDENIGEVIVGLIAQCMFPGLSLDHTRALYDAFTKSVRDAMKGARFQVEISDKTILDLDDGRFALVKHN
jgi:hypothetical protein